MLSSFRWRAALALSIAIGGLLAAPGSSLAINPACGVANNNICATVTDFDPLAPGDAVGQDTIQVANNGGNTVNDVNLTLTGATFGNGGTSVSWNFKQLKAGQAVTVSALVKSLPFPGTITTCATANWNENGRNGGRQDHIVDPGACEDTTVSAGAARTIVPTLAEGQGLGLGHVKLGTDPGGSEVGKATVPLVATFQGTATINANAGDPSGYTCDSDKVRINGKQYACRGGPFFLLTIQDSSGDSPLYPANNPIVAEFTEPSGRFDDNLPLAVFHALNSGGVDGLATALCDGSSVPDPPNGCFAENPSVQNGLTHFLVKWRHNSRYH